MNAEEYYLFLPSNAPSPSSQPNTVSKFTTQLAEPIKLTGNWEVALIEVFHPGLHPEAHESDSLELMYIYSDIIEPIFVGNDYGHLLRVTGFHEPGNDYHLAVQTFIEPWYLPVATATIKEIGILLANYQGRPIKFKPERSEVTLHLRKKSQDGVSS